MSVSETPPALGEMAFSLAIAAFATDSAIHFTSTSSLDAISLMLQFFSARMMLDNFLAKVPLIGAPRIEALTCSHCSIMSAANSDSRFPPAIFSILALTILSISVILPSRRFCKPKPTTTCRKMSLGSLVSFFRSMPSAFKLSFRTRVISELSRLEPSAKGALAFFFAPFLKKLSAMRCAPSSS